jgi:hypothetical protein
MATSRVEGALLAPKDNVTERSLLMACAESHDAPCDHLNADISRLRSLETDAVLLASDPALTGALTPYQVSVLRTGSPNQILEALGW